MIPASALPLIVALLLAGCVRSSVLDYASDTIQITTSAAPVCGQAGAQKVANRQAAVETIKHGYDKYMVLDAGYKNDVRVVGMTPVIANTQGSATVNSFGNTAIAHGQSTTTYSGGMPIVGGRHTQGVVIKMFRNGDPGSGNAINARNELGPNWKKVIKKSSTTTC